MVFSVKVHMGRKRPDWLRRVVRLGAKSSPCSHAAGNERSRTRLRMGDLVFYLVMGGIGAIWLIFPEKVISFYGWFGPAAKWTPRTPRTVRSIGIFVLILVAMAAFLETFGEKIGFAHQRSASFASARP